MIALIDPGSGFWTDFLWYTVWGVLSMIVIFFVVITLLDKVMWNTQQKEGQAERIDVDREGCVSIINGGLVDEHFKMIDIHLGNPALRNMDLLPFQKEKIKIKWLWNEAVNDCLDHTLPGNDWHGMRARLMLYKNNADSLQREIEILILDTAQQRSYHREELWNDNYSSLEERTSLN